MLITSRYQTVKMVLGFNVVAPFRTLLVRTVHIFILNQNSSSDISEDSLSTK